MFPGRDGRILVFEPGKQQFHQMPLTAKGFAMARRGMAGDLFVDGSRVPSIVALGRDGTMRTSSEKVGCLLSPLLPCSLRC